MIKTLLAWELWWKSVHELEDVILKFMKALDDIQLSVRLSGLFFFCLKGICTKLDVTYV